MQYPSLISQLGVHQPDMALHQALHRLGLFKICKTTNGSDEMKLNRMPRLESNHPTKSTLGEQYFSSRLS